VHDLSEALNKAKAEVAELSAILEDPSKHPKAKNLAGEDPE